MRFLHFNRTGYDKLNKRIFFHIIKIQKNISSVNLNYIKTIKQFILLNYFYFIKNHSLEYHLKIQV